MTLKQAWPEGRTPKPMMKPVKAWAVIDKDGDFVDQYPSIEMALRNCSESHGECIARVVITEAVKG